MSLVKIAQILIDEVADLMGIQAATDILTEKLLTQSANSGSEIIKLL